MEVVNLKECTSYTCKVSYPRADEAEFVESEEVRGTTDINPISKIPPPNPVDASAFYQRGEDYIQVRWSAPAEMTTCISGYQVAWRENVEGEEENEFNVVEIDRPDVFSLKLDDLIRPCVNHDIKVWAKSKMGGDRMGEEGMTSIETRQRAPGPVGSLKKIEKGDGYVMITWRKPEERPQCVDNYEYRVTGGELTCDPDPIPFSAPGRVLHDDHQVLHDQDHQVLQRTFKSKEQEDDVVTFKLDCLKCDERYTFEVWAVDKEDNMSPIETLSDIQPNECDHSAATGDQVPPSSNPSSNPSSPTPSSPSTGNPESSSNTNHDPTSSNSITETTTLGSTEHNSSSTESTQSSKNYSALTSASSSFTCLGNSTLRAGGFFLLIAVAVLV